MLQSTMPSEFRLGNLSPEATSANNTRRYLNLNEPPTEGGLVRYVMLQKDKKKICRVQVLNPPFDMPHLWNISEIKPPSFYALSGLPRCFLRPAFEDSHQKKEWKEFLIFLKKYNRIAAVSSGGCDFYILPPDAEPEFSHVAVQYKAKAVCLNIINAGLESTDAAFQRPPACYQEISIYEGEDVAESSGANVAGEDCMPRESNMSKQQLLESWPLKILGKSYENHPNAFPTTNYVKTDPSYLRTLSQTHSGWIFGAIAELIDNSRDAKATRLDISIQSFYSKIAEGSIPVLSIIDDGCGMSHSEINVMLSFGHKQPDRDDPDRIGRFGIGFKTGAMRLGRDAIVLTQNANSRSVALLSQSYNDGKENLEIPIVSYCRKGTFMEVDTNVHPQSLADYNLKAIREFSPFNEYFIGEKLALFGESGTGTQIYIWNLDKWGSNYSLEWVGPKEETNSSSHGEHDILIRSRRIRSRPGQISQKVPLDYSLKSYLEVIFLYPRMKISVQGSQVKSHPLAKSLNRTSIMKGEIRGRSVELTLGRSRIEWERANCGIFLYWHGRLVEAYKRVGGMVHNADMGRGVIGVIDATELMSDDDGDAMVLNSKQGFQDCEIYAQLEEWLGNRCDEFWDANFDTLDMRKGNSKYEPDHEWVQCDKCRKWRILSTRFDTSSLPATWFCYMSPFNGKCETPEQTIEAGVITVGTKRNGCQSKEAKHVQSKQSNSRSESHLQDTDGISDEIFSQTIKGSPQLPRKRLRRGPTRNHKKVELDDVKR